MQTIKGINFKSLLVSSLIAGYAMFMVDKWGTGMFGGFLFGLFPGTDSWAWMLTHHVDGIVFALPFAAPAVYRALPGTGWVKGLSYGFLFWLALPFIGGMIGSALGSKPLAEMTGGGMGAMVTVILLHLLYGSLLGALYTPPEEVQAGSAV